MSGDPTCPPTGGHTERPEEFSMPLSRAITGTALLLKRHTPRFYASIRNNAPRKLRSIINERMKVDVLGSDDPKQVFTNIFRRNWWNNDESRSGWGAELRRTVSIRAALPDFVQRHSVQSLLDAPCGDFHWMKYVHWPSGFRYGGVPISNEIALCCDVPRKETMRRIFLVLVMLSIAGGSAAQEARTTPDARPSMPYAGTAFMQDDGSISLRLRLTSDGKPFDGT